MPPPAMPARERAVTSCRQSDFLPAPPSPPTFRWVRSSMSCRSPGRPMPADMRSACPLSWQGTGPLFFGHGPRATDWKPVRGTFRFQPTDAAPVVPRLLLVPMLAFDPEGYRLGYGGGFYDRTLQELRRSGRTVTAVGVCYAGLEVDAVPRQTHDARLDWIVTEDGAWSTGEVA